MQPKQSSSLFQPLEIQQAQRSSNQKGQNHYDAYYQYLMSIIGFAVGYGSFWRFPYLVYKNGGGAFLIPYFFALVTIGMPMIYLQTVVGQMNQKSIPFIFERINKGLKFLGFTFMFIIFHLVGYYNIILTYSYRLMMSAFVVPLPFVEQDPLDNTYFTQNILKRSDSISDFGSINPWLLFFYLLSLYVCYLVVRKGVKTSGKIVIITVLIPYIFFVILLINGIFLDGAVQGLKYLFVPDFSKLFKIEIWVDAFVQVFFQTCIGTSGIVNLSSMKPKNEKFLIGIYLIPLSFVICSFLCSLNVFTYLGHFCYQSNVLITDLHLHGVELSFSVFPKALAILPWPNLWVFFFFFAMVLLGIDTQFAQIESLFCYINNEARNNEGKISILNFTISKETCQKIIIIASCFFCPFLVSSAGIYYLGFFDSFTQNVPLSIGVIVEYYIFVHFFPFEEFQKESYKSTGQKAPKWVQILLQGKFLMVILLGNLLFACIDQFFNFMEYSLGFYAFGWIITSYPYILAFLYWIKYREEKSKLSFKEITDK